MHAWSDKDKGEWPPGFPEARRTSYDLGEIRTWLEVFVRRFFAFSQFKRSALPNGPKVAAGGSLSPRGDWRAAPGGHAPGRAGGTRGQTPPPRTPPPGGAGPPS